MTDENHVYVARWRDGRVETIADEDELRGLKMKLMNLTPHTITISSPEDGDLVIPPSGTVARVTTDEQVLSQSPIPIIRRSFGEVTGLPDDPDVPVIVSSIVLAALPGRPNTYAPDTGPSALRNDAGQIVAVTRLVAASEQPDPKIARLTARAGLASTEDPADD